MKCLKQCTYIRYVIARLSKLVQTACWLPQIPFYTGFFENQKEPGTSFQDTFSIELSDKSYLVMLNKMAKFHYQAASASQVIQ